MNVTIHSVKFDADAKLLSFIEYKVNKLEVFYDDILGSDVILKIEKETQERENKIVEIKLDIAKNPLFSKKQSKTFEEATDLATDALRKQLIKHKNKLKKK